MNLSCLYANQINIPWMSVLQILVSFGYILVYSLQWNCYIKVIVEVDFQQNPTNSACLIDTYQVPRKTVLHRLKYTHGYFPVLFATQSL